MDKVSQKVDRLGKGGVSKAYDRLEAMEAANKLISKRIAYKEENLSNMYLQLYDMGDGNFKWPTEGGVVSSNFGYRRNPFGGYAGDFHGGIDIAAPYGAPIYASSTGKVEMAQWNGGYGKYVKVNHGNGYETSYAHMSTITARVGATVKKGEVIGYVGSTGYSTGPHIHFEIKNKGQVIDPMTKVQIQ